VTPFPAVSTVPAATVVSTPPPLHGCTVSALGLHALTPRKVRAPRPASAVDDVRNVRGEGSRATSRTPVFYADGQQVSFYSSRSYVSLVCARYTLVDLTGTVIFSQPSARGHHGVNLRGDRFELTVREEPRRRRQPVTYDLRLRIPRIHYDRTAKRLVGTLLIKR